MSAALDRAPCATPAWRPRRRRQRPQSWPWWLAAALHAAALAALFANLAPPVLPEPLVVEGTPLVWEGPVGAAEGAPELSPEGPSTSVEPVEASAPPQPTAQLPPAEASPDLPAAAPSGPAEPSPPAEAAPALPEPAAEAPPPRPAEAAAPAPRAERAQDLPLPLPAAPPAPPRPAPPPAPSAASLATPPPAPAPLAEAAAGAVRLGAGTTGAPGDSRPVGAPQPGCNDQIPYPASERARGVTGAVNLRLRVSDDGRVVEARVTEPSGSFALDEAARTGIRRCRFLPSLRDGAPVWGTRDYRVVFRLD